MAWRKIYPADVAFKLRQIRGHGNIWVVELSICYDGGVWNYGCSIFECRDDKVARETIYFAGGAAFLIVALMFSRISCKWMGKAAIYSSIFLGAVCSVFILFPG